MKRNAKSSITLQREELKLVLALKARLKARTNVDVVRRGLRLLQDVTERESLREAYRRSSRDPVVAVPGDARVGRAFSRRPG